MRKSIKDESDYQPDFENDTDQQSQRIKTNESDIQASSQSRDFTSSSLSIDKEVNDLVMSQEIDW